MENRVGSANLRFRWVHRRCLKRRHTRVKIMLSRNWISSSDWVAPSITRWCEKDALQRRLLFLCVEGFFNGGEDLLDLLGVPLEEAVTFGPLGVDQYAVDRHLEVATRERR